MDTISAGDPRQRMGPGTLLAAPAWMMFLSSPLYSRIPLGTLSFRDNARLRKDYDQAYKSRSLAINKGTLGRHVFIIQ